jgi:hypothetical protein
MRIGDVKASGPRGGLSAGVVGQPLIVLASTTPANDWYP